MAIVLGEPGVDGLSEAVSVLQEWQYDGSPMQLHPGDLGWFWRFGAEARPRRSGPGAGTDRFSLSGC